MRLSIVLVLVLFGCSEQGVSTDVGVDARWSDGAVADDGPLRSDTRGTDSAAFDFVVGDLVVLDQSTPDLTAPDQGSTSPDLGPLDPFKVSPGTGYTPAIALDTVGQPHVAFGALVGTQYELQLSSRSSTGWQSTSLTTLAGAVEAISMRFDPAGLRRISYSQLVVSSGVGHAKQFWAHLEGSSGWSQQDLGFQSYNHNTAVRPDAYVSSAGDVHLIAPLTKALSAASTLRHVGVVGGLTIDETLAPLLPSSPFGLGIGHFGAAVAAEPALGLFTAEDDATGPDTRIYFSQMKGGVLEAELAGSFPDLGSSMTEVWRVDAHWALAGPIGVSTNSKAPSGDVHFRVMRRTGTTWSMQTVTRPKNYSTSQWCSTVFPDGEVVLLVHAGVGSPVTHTELRVIRFSSQGSFTDQVVAPQVDGGPFCDAVTDAQGIHLVYRKLDAALYYLYLPR